MKRSLILSIAMLLVALSSFARKPKPINKVDSVALINAVAMYDEGNYTQALDVFTELAEKYPHDYIINYERILPLYRLERYDEALEIAKKLVKMKDCDTLGYQLYGNLLDMKGDPNEALAIYDKGLKKFPDSGILYLEKGNIYNTYEYYKEAIACFNQGIKVEPDFPSNYYRGALAQFENGNKVWGLVYAEAEILLNLGGHDRHAHMAGEIRKHLSESLSVSGDTIKCRLSPSIDITVSSGGKNPQFNLEAKNVYIGFPGVYNACIEKAAAAMQRDSIAFDPESLRYLGELRRRAVEYYFADTDNLYGESMYLLEYHKKVIDAGFWDTYNAIIFAPAYYDDREEELAEITEQQVESFAGWFRENPFILGEGRTVGEFSIFNHFTPLTMAEAMCISAILSSRGDDPKLQELRRALLEEAAGNQSEGGN